MSKATTTNTSRALNFAKISHDETKNNQMKVIGS